MAALLGASNSAMAGTPRALSRVLLIKENDFSQNISALANPNSIEQNLRANWVRQNIVISAYQHLQYGNTDSVDFDVEFYVSAFIASNAGQPDYPERFRRFLTSLLYPWKTVATSNTFAPPSGVFFIWPKLLTFRGVLTEVRFKYERMAHNGAPLIYRATCKFTEVFGARQDDEIMTRGPFVSSLGGPHKSSTDDLLGVLGAAGFIGEDS